jgi:hypothetical protein
MSEKRSTYSDMVVKPEGQGILGKSTKRWENDMKMGLTEIVLEDLGWIKSGLR